MAQQQVIKDGDTIIQPKKEYKKPVLTVLGKVSELTGGSRPPGDEDLPTELEQDEQNMVEPPSTFQ